MPEVTITLENADDVQRRLRALADPDAVRSVMDAAGAGARVAALDHFRARESEPEKTQGFPKFGQSYGKRYFWSGTRGTSVAEAVGPAAYDAAEASVTIPIDSPALAHKANPSPPPITPKGGRKFLALPASARAAAWAGMPRDFSGAGPLTFAYSKAPDGRWLRALVAASNFTRVVTRGKNKGARVAAKAGQSADGGIGEPMFWLVRSVKTPHDPRAMPAAEELSARASDRAASVLSRLSPDS